MRRMRTLVVVGVVAVLVGVSGCRKRVVVVPNTTEGLKCERECLQIFHACQAGNGRNARVCREESESCRETCPGAMFSDGRPARGGIASGLTAPVPAPANAEVPAPTAPSEVAAPPAPKKCIASELPEWQSASAAEKKALLERCK